MRVEPLVTVLVTSLGPGRFLADAIESALAQRYRRVEVVVVDDGATEATRLTLERFGDRIVPVLAPGGGQARALNAGFAASRGDLVLTLDADDRLTEDAAARVAAAWRPGVAKVQYRLRVVGEDGRPLGTVLPDARLPLPEGDLRREVLGRFLYPAPPTSGNAYGREVVTCLLPIPDEEWPFAADAYLAACLPFHGPVVAIDAPLGDYRVYRAVGADRRDGDLAWLARKAAETLRREAVVRRTAESFGFRAAPDLALRDVWCAAARLALRVADRAASPRPEEGRLFLAARGLAATARHRHGSLGARAGLAAWFALLPLLPAGLARPLVRAALARRRAALVEARAA